MREELTIIDGTALLFRMYFAGVEHQSPKGVEVGGVMGAVRTLAAIVEKLQSKYFTIVFDAGAKTFRNEITSSYKANRGPPPDNLRPQFDLLHRAAQELGFRVFRKAGYEADDLVATLATHFSKNKIPVKMLSNDKDVAQLVTDSPTPVQQVLYFKKLILGEKEIYENFGVRPNQFIDFQALIGDTSDNISGVKGIGKKSAAGLLAHFPDLDSIYDSLEEVLSLPIRGAKSLKTKLENGKEDAYLSKRLVTLDCEVPMEVGDVESFRYQGPLDSGEEFFESLGFVWPLHKLQRYAENQSF
jgi:DNA polymerase-1